jgi:hypothetical protein
VGVCAFKRPTVDKISVPSDEALLKYELAVADFCYTCDRAVLYRTLISIGIGRRDCRWHAAHPGQRRRVRVGTS